MKTTRTLPVAVLLLFAVAGCSLLKTNSGQPLSMASQLHLAKQTYNSAGTFAAQLVESGAVKDQATKDVIYAASEEANLGIDDAERRIAAGDKPGFDFVMKRVQSALDRLAKVNAQHKRPATQPVLK